MGTLNWEVEFECQMDYTTGLTNHPNFAIYNGGDSSWLFPYGWADYLPYKISCLDEVIERNWQYCRGTAVCKVRHGKPVVGKRMLHPKVSAERGFDDVFQASMLAARRRAIRHDDCLQHDDCGDTFVASAGESFFAWRYFFDGDVPLIEGDGLSLNEPELLLDTL